MLPPLRCMTGCHMCACAQLRLNVEGSMQPVYIVQ